MNASVNSRYSKQLKADKQRKLKRSIDQQLFRRFKSRRNHIIKAVLIILTIVVVCFSQVLLRETKLVRQRYKNSELTRQIKELKLANDSLRESLAKLFDVKTLTEKAREIGLEKPTLDQIISIPIPQINQLSVNLQSANAKEWRSKDELTDYRLIYRNLAEYYEHLAGSYSKQSVQAAKSSVVYGEDTPGADGVLIRKPNQVDPGFLKRQQENAKKLQASKKQANPTQTKKDQAANQQALSQQTTSNTITNTDTFNQNAATPTTAQEKGAATDNNSTNVPENNALTTEVTAAQATAAAAS